MRMWLVKIIWWWQKISNKDRRLNEKQRDELIGYYENTNRVFESLGIDIKAKPTDQRRLYAVMLVYLDQDEVIYSSGARTAMLIQFLDSCKSGWTLPPASEPVSSEFAKDIDGYVAVEILGNNLGIKDIRDELIDAINSNSKLLRRRIVS
jgi:hypothetical protein